MLHDWLKKRISIPWSTDLRCLARVVDGEIIGIVGYEGFTGTACRMHMAGEKGWITREFIWRAFNYPFGILDLDMVFALVPSGNKTALEIDLRWGFRELMYLKGAHPDGGLHFLRMTKKEWKRSKFYGWKSSRSA